MEIWRFGFTKISRKALKRLPSGIREQLYGRLGLFVKNQFDKLLNNHSVEGAFPDCRSINITGDYRAIFYGQEDIVVFIAIGTHAQLY